MKYLLYFVVYTINTNFSYVKCTERTNLIIRVQFYVFTRCLIYCFISKQIWRKTFFKWLRITGIRSQLIFISIANFRVSGTLSILFKISCKVFSIRHCFKYLQDSTSINCNNLYLIYSYPEQNRIHFVSPFGMIEKTNIVQFYYFRCFEIFEVLQKKIYFRNHICLSVFFKVFTSIIFWKFNHYKIVF